MSDTARLSPVRRWAISLRAYSFTASLVPAALAAALALGSPGRAVWWTLPLFALSAVLFHACTNVLNDYYDYLHGVDPPDDPDPTHAITRGVVSPGFMRTSGHLYFLLGIAVGLPIGLERGWVFVVAGLLGAAGAFFYTNARFSFKYVALGDLLVFLLMGPALVIMGTWAMAGRADGGTVLASLPIALHVTAIMHGNNLRNTDSDRESGVVTLAGILGTRASKALFAALTLLPFVLAGTYAAIGVLPVHALLVLVSAPQAVRLTGRVVRTADPAELVALPLFCARVHLAFGILYTLGVAVSEVAPI